MARAFDRASDLERARLDPSVVFIAAEQVLAVPQLTRDEKIEILPRWSYDSGEPALPDRILAALDQLDGQGG